MFLQIMRPLCHMVPHYYSVLSSCIFLLKQANRHVFNQILRMQKTLWMFIPDSAPERPTGKAAAMEFPAGRIGRRPSPRNASRPHGA